MASKDRSKSKQPAVSSSPDTNKMKASRTAFSRTRSGESTVNLPLSGTVPWISENLRQGLFLFFMAALLIFTLIPAPEGSVRLGDVLPAVEGWLLVLCLMVGDSLFVTWTPANFHKEEQVKRSFQFHFADGLVSVFTLWISVSTFILWWTENGNLRFAANSFSLWFLAILIYCFFRTLNCSRYRNFLNVFFLIVIAIVLAESFYGIYCYTIRDPAFRRAYLADPETMLAQNGFNFPVGSPERILLENRLLSSSEPLGTFGLTNTLAGLLAPWLVMMTGALGWGILNLKNYFSRTGKNINGIATKESEDSTFRQIPKSKRISLMGSLCLIIAAILPVFFCLLLTKSRSGVLAFLFGLFLYGVLIVVFSGLQRKESEKRKKWLGRLVLFFGGMLLCAILGTIIAFQVGILDKEVFSEAGKSLGYRLEYWTASGRMIQENPWFGVGPGNFQTIYPYYMLAKSSEIIADPHNFAFETATSFGVPALLILLILFSSILLIPFFQGRTLEKDDDTEQKDIEGLRNKEWQEESLDNNIPVLTVVDHNTSDRDNNSEPKHCTGKNVSVLPCSKGFLFIAGLSGALLTWFVSQLLSAPVDFIFILFFGVTLALTIITGSFIFWRGKELFSKEQWHLFVDISLICGIITVLINLGAAGGMAYPPVFFTLWCFLALIVNRRTDKLVLNRTTERSEVNREKVVQGNSERDVLKKYGTFGTESKSQQSDDNRSGQYSQCKQQNKSNYCLLHCRNKKKCLLCFLILLSVIYFIGILRPTFLGEMLNRQLEYSGSAGVELTGAGLHEEQKVSSFLDSNRTDPNQYSQVDTWSISLARQSYNRAVLLCVAQCSEANQVILDRARAHLIKVSPHSSGIRFLIGQTELNYYQRSRNAYWFRSVLSMLEEAVELAPVDAKYRVIYAKALLEANQKEKAVQECQKAMELDDQMPHRDRKLPSELRLWAEQHKEL